MIVPLLHTIPIVFIYSHGLALKNIFISEIRIQLTSDDMSVYLATFFLGTFKYGASYNWQDIKFDEIQ